MAARVKRFVVGAAAAAAVVAAAAWFDTTVVAGAEREASTSFDLTQSGLIYGIGGTGLAGLVLTVAWVGWRCRSLALGIAYALVGGLFAFLLYFAVAFDGSPLDLPGGTQTVLGNLASSTYGPLNAVSTVGGMMIIVGAAQIVASIAERRAAPPPTNPLEVVDGHKATIEDVSGPA
jgi:hypothetical protein